MSHLVLLHNVQMKYPASKEDAEKALFFFNNKRFSFSSPLSLSLYLSSLNSYFFPYERTYEETDCISYSKGLS